MSEDQNTMARMEAHLDRIGREMKTMRELLSKAVNYMIQAESEVPEKVRRFITYMHDIHDVTYMYEERGLPVPEHLLREMERCDDRYRQVLKEQHTDTGTFEKIRREMASDPENRWDHTRLLSVHKPVEKKNETVEPKQEVNVRRFGESRTEPKGN